MKKRKTDEKYDHELLNRSWKTKTKTRTRTGTGTGTRTRTKNFAIEQAKPGCSKRIANAESDISGSDDVWEEDKTISLGKLSELQGQSCPSNQTKTETPIKRTKNPSDGQSRTIVPNKTDDETKSVVKKKTLKNLVETVRGVDYETKSVVKKKTLKNLVETVRGVDYETKSVVNKKTLKDFVSLKNMDKINFVNQKLLKTAENSAIDRKMDDQVKSKMVSNLKTPTKDDQFREFRRVCANVAEIDAYKEKTAILRNMFLHGSTGDGFKSDIVLWCKLLLPQAAKRIYNLQSKQLIKLFSRILSQSEDQMLEDLEQGDIAETIRLFFESSTAIKTSPKSLLTIQEVDQFLEILSGLTKEEEQIHHFKTIIDRCTGNDLKMIIRLIKHDLRINAGPKHILNAVHEDAFKAFQVSMNLETVVKRFLPGTSTSSLTSTKETTLLTSPGGSKIELCLMTPVLPMLAEACKSVEMAMKKCGNGIFAEIKYDGERVQVHKKGTEFQYFSRSLKPVMAHKIRHFKDYIPEAFPDGDDLILDSEILLIDNKTGKPLPFGSLGIHKKSKFKDANVCLFVFDCIYYNGEVLINKSVQERRQILKSRMTEIPNRIMLSECQEVHNPKDLAEMIAKILRLGLEGLVLKDIKSKYEPGKRHWLKVKKDYLFDGAMADSADLVVLGAWYGTGQKGGMMSIFLMGCYDPDMDKWLTVTKVHSGHDDAMLEVLQNKLDMIKISKDPAKVPKWLLANKPMVPDFVARDPKKQPVWEITGAEFTNQGVHTADGISIRFPRVTRIRDDKNWSTATNLNELRELFKKSSDSLDFSILLGADNSDKKDPELVASVSSTFSIADEIDTEKNISSKRLKIEETNVNDDEEKTKEKIKTEGAKIRIKKEFQIDQPNTSKNLIKEIETYEEIVETKEEPDLFDVSYEPDIEIQEGGSPIETLKYEESLMEYEIDSERDTSAKYYSFVDKDYIEYNERGSPLNWVNGRKPEKGLPFDAQPLSDNMENILKSKGIFRDVRVTLSHDIKKIKRKSIYRELKTLGAIILKDSDRHKSTHVIHDRKEIPSSVLKYFQDVPKSARHVNSLWLKESAASSEMKNICSYAVTLAADYCNCTCNCTVNHQ